jgi:hypothetical protein
VGDQRRLRQRHQRAAGNNDYDDYDEGLSISFFRHFALGEEPPDTGGGRVFSFDASFGLLANRRFGTGLFRSTLNFNLFGVSVRYEECTKKM